MAFRKRPWIILVLILGVMAASVLGVFGGTYFRALRIIDEFAVESDRRSDEWSRTGAVRPPVFGGPLEGNAWTLYAPVLSQWRQIPGIQHLLVPGKRWQSLKEADFLPTMAPSIDRLRRALAAEAGAPGLGENMAAASKDACVSLYYAALEAGLTTDVR
jgi:hypothetical protein